METLHRSHLQLILISAQVFMLLVLNAVDGVPYITVLPIERMLLCLV